MREAQPKAIRLTDYRPPNHLVDTVALTFDLGEGQTEVTAELAVRRNPQAEAGLPLELNHNQLEIVTIEIDGVAIGPEDYRIEDELLTIEQVPESFTLRVVTRTEPEKNTALEGLYKSSGNYCTQCEAEGFRRITCFPDRPDVMAVYTTTIIADRQSAPVLLSNGNLIDSGELENGRHYATWHDPHPKPSYLFALVAGDLVKVSDHFTTASGREVLLEIYVQQGNEDKCDHAMRSLKKAMAWDEQKYGREYDLDRYMIVAVDDFNMGAMENKGLNVFNSRFVLARQETATDIDFVNIEGVIAHEYFHNWSGNRVTCRDWFQLSLKEGFTVFRDTQFTADMTSAAVKRIDDVTLLRTHQFVEDAGPMAHPIRPDSYIEINNFYTLTVYEKGAEVVRMLHTLLGEEGFRRGSDLYFERFDGQAVTTDDFVSAMEEANGVDLSTFRRWYGQAGTPVVEAAGEYDAARKRYTLTLRQNTPPTPGQQEKQPLHIPVKLSLLDGDGHMLPLQLEGESAPQGEERVLDLTGAQQSFTFVDVNSAPVPSLLRGFSAPVKLNIERDESELAFLMAHESDPFNRWDAAQQLAVARIRSAMAGAGDPLDQAYAEAFLQTLNAEGLDDALKAEALSLPAVDYIAEFVEPIDPEAIYLARQRLAHSLAETHRAVLLERYRALALSESYALTPEAMGRRRLANTLLDYLASLGGSEIDELLWRQFNEADNMTDTLAALRSMVNYGSGYADEALAQFYSQWRHDPLVLDKWFAIQAAAPLAETVEKVEQLLDHPDFTLTNPNRARSVLGSFGMRNPRAFHRADGAGYRLLADRILALNDLNPQVAARLITPLTGWRRYKEELGSQMRGELERIAGAESLSRDLYEVVKKSLDD